MSKVLTSLPVGERVGIAFSGGLDTSVAVAWMRAKGAVPCTYTADIGQYDEPDIAGVPDRALQYGAELARAVDCRRQLVEEGLAAMACGAFHIRSGGRAYFNTTPLGRAVTGTMLVRAMHEDGVDIWGDGSTFKGNDIERFYRYGLLANPDLRIYKPWLDADFVHELGGRAEMSQWLDRARPALPRQPGEGLLHRRQHLGRHPRGQDARAPRRLARDRRADHGREVLGPRGRDRARGRHGPLRGGPAGRDQRRPVRRPGRAGPRGQRRSAAGTASACPTRSRTGSSRPSRAASTRRPAWRCSGSPTSGCSTPSTTRTPSPTTTREGRRLGRLLYEGRWLDPQALMLRESIQRWIASLVTGEVTLRLRRGEDYTILRTDGRALLLPPRQALDGAHRERRVRSDRPDRPAHDAQPRHRRLARQARAVRRAAARPGPGPGRARHPATASSSRAAPTGSPATRPPRATPSDEALDNAAMEFGTD